MRNTSLIVMTFVGLVAGHLGMAKMSEGQWQKCQRGTELIMQVEMKMEEMGKCFHLHASFGCSFHVLQKNFFFFFFEFGLLTMLTLRFALYQ